MTQDRILDVAAFVLVTVVVMPFAICAASVISVADRKVKPIVTLTRAYKSLIKTTFMGRDDDY